MQVTQSGSVFRGRGSLIQLGGHLILPDVRAGQNFSHEKVSGNSPDPQPLLVCAVPVIPSDLLSVGHQASLPAEQAPA